MRGLSAHFFKSFRLAEQPRNHFRVGCLTPQATEAAARTRTRGRLAALKEHEPLNRYEIDKLCERLNVSDRLILDTPK